MILLGSNNDDKTHLAMAHGITWLLSVGTEEVNWNLICYPLKNRFHAFTKANYFQIYQELKSKDVTLQLLWAEYVEHYDNKARRHS